MNLGAITSHIPKKLPRMLGGAALLGIGAVALSACGGSRLRDPNHVAIGVVQRHDRGITGADQAKTGERSLSLDGEHRIIESKRVIQDRGAFSNAYKKFDEVRDISHLLETADTNKSGDASISELTATIGKFDRDGDGFLNREENVDYDLEFAPEVSEVNVRYDRDLNEDGSEAIGDGIGILIDGIFGD